MFENMAIKELARLCGVSTRTLRYYEEVSLLKPRRMDNNYRTYDFDAVGRVELILTLKQSGMPLEQIKSFLAEPKDVEGVLESQKAVLQQEMKRLEQSIAFIERQQRTARLFREQGPNRLFIREESLRECEIVQQLSRSEPTVLLESDELSMAIEASESPEIYLVRPLSSFKPALTAGAFFTGERRIRHRQRAFIELLAQHDYTCKSLIYSESCCLLGREEVHFMWCEIEDSRIDKASPACHNEPGQPASKEENTMVKDLWYASEHHIPVLGHRGICARYPENTLPSFEAALDLGVDLIEFDVNLTREGELVVIHDNTIDRTSDHCGPTRDYTLAELKTFNFSAKFALGFAPTQIPTLREVLELVNRRSDTVLLNVEIKDKTHEVVDMTVAMLHEYGLAERSVIACFDAEIVRYTKSAHPEMRTQGFPGRYMTNFTEETYDCMFGMGIPIGSTDEQLKEDIELARSRGILAWLFCADTDEAVRRCVAFGTDNITGNDPAVALNTLRSMGLHK